MDFSAALVRVGFSGGYLFRVSRGRLLMCVQGISRLPERWHSAHTRGAAVKSRCLPADSAIPAMVPSLLELLNFGF